MYDVTEGRQRGGRQRPNRARAGTSHAPMAAAAHKAKGSEHFAAGRYVEAVRCYGDAIGAESEPKALALLLGNRSMADVSIKLNKPSEAVADATRAIQLDPGYLKGYFRQTTALMALSRHAEAVAAATEGLRRDPKNAQLQNLLQEAKAAAAEHMGDGDDEDDDMEDEDMEDEDEEDGDDDDDSDDEEAADEPMHTTGENGGPTPPPRPSAPSVSPEVQAEQAKEAGTVEYKRGDYSRAVQLYSQAIALAPTNATYLRCPGWHESRGSGR